MDNLTVRQPVPCVSVIVPIYNTAPWLRTCLDSLFVQTLQEIEIICVNDGSLDESLSILHDYAARDGRIRIIDQPNQGVSVARNAGVAAAAGSYLMFVDSDDWVEPDFCRVPYMLARDSCADVVVFGFWHDKDEKRNSRCKSGEGKWRDLSAETDRLHLVTHGGNVWDKCWNRRAWLENGVFFPKGMRLGEDVFAQCQGVMFSTRILELESKFYHYRNRSGSATKGQGWDQSLAVAPEMIQLLRGKIVHMKDVSHYRIFVAALSLTLYRIFYIAMPPERREEGIMRIRTALTEEDLRFVRDGRVLSWPRRLFYETIQGSRWAAVFNWGVVKRVRLVRWLGR